MASAAERALELILAIDRLRDEVPDERELAAGIVTTLADAVEAELCLLCLRDDDTGELQLKAVIDRVGVYGEAGAEQALRALALQAAELTQADFLQTDVTLKQRRLTCGLAGPLRVNGESLGALLLLNADRPFDADERKLVGHAFSQIDSAMHHLRTMRELRRRQRELETIYRIDRIRDHTPDFQALLEAVLGEVVSAMEAETGFLMLYDRLGNALEMRAITNQDLFAVEAAAHLMRSVAQEAIATADLVNHAYASGPIRAVVGVPLLLGNKLIGVLGVVNRTRGAQRFTRSDLDMLRAIGSQMDTAIFESLQTQRLRSAFGQSVGPQVMDRLLSIADRDLLSGERRTVTTLFSDIRGFTDMSEHIAPEALQDVLNDHLSTLTDLVLAHEGTLDKYIGDCIMCCFNAPEDQLDHAERAVRLALALQQAHRAVMARWQGKLPLPPIGIGISTGETMMGNFGSVKRLEYTAIGRDVNLAARLCAAADGDQTLISEETYALVAPLVVAEELPPLRLKGIVGEVKCWNVKQMR